MTERRSVEGCQRQGAGRGGREHSGQYVTPARFRPGEFPLPIRPPVEAISSGKAFSRRTEASFAPARLPQPASCSVYAGGHEAPLLCPARPAPFGSASWGRAGHGAWHDGQPQDAGEWAWQQPRSVLRKELCSRGLEDAAELFERYDHLAWGSSATYWKDGRVLRKTICMGLAALEAAVAALAVLWGYSGREVETWRPASGMLVSLLCHVLCPPGPATFPPGLRPS